MTKTCVNPCNTIYIYIYITAFSKKLSNLIKELKIIKKDKHIENSKK